jgi:hypothetical protein
VLVFANRLWGGVAMFMPEGLLGQINVEIDGLKSAAAVMRAELEAGFRSQVTPFNDAMQSGASIGGVIAGAEFKQLQQTYSTYITATRVALDNLGKGTYSVATAADIIAEKYSDADALSRARVDEVQKVIAYTPPPPPQFGPYLPKDDV